ncbi:MAG: hypothetical protein IT261_00705 [Saprospiraceae bacterium]|nr:hypothetical protein [Saprospiraceae bacterium]
MKVILAALAGAVTSFLSGWVIYGMLLKNYMDANTLEAARSVIRPDEEMIFWAIFAASFFWSLLMALIFTRWAGISTFKTGAIAGCWVSLLIALGAGFYSYSMLNLHTLSYVFVDGLVNAVQGLLVGGVIGWVLGVGNKA